MSAPQLQLYTRPGCHLCEALLAEAAPLLERHGARVESINIDEDPALQRRYDRSIPVLVLGGREICRHRLDAHALEAALHRSNADCGC
jgi:glutaredoxin